MMYVRVNARDNVAIIVDPEGAAAGAELSDGLITRERIPQAHKVALADLACGEPVVRYGHIIGIANRPIAAGSWVREELLDLPAPPPLDRSANTTPGNKRGGLANIVEKALGSVAKAGTSAIAAVASHGEKVGAKGLVFAATPASDFICGTQQLASMNFHVFTTGEGSPYGLSLVPVLKISSRTALAEKWHDLIDVDAGRIATGRATIEQVGWDIFHGILEAAGGKRKTWAERWGLGNALAPFNPGPVT